MSRAAVLGSPIAHSLSPALHRAAYAALGLHDWSYAVIECDEAGLADLLEGLDASWVGLSLTMPLKRTVLPLLDEVSELATAVGAANTVVFDGGRRVGDNTDVAGITGALRESGVSDGRSALVLGAGATACSALAALRELRVAEITVIARSRGRTAELRAAARRLGVDVDVRAWSELHECPTLLGDSDLVVSTVPVGAADEVVPLMAGCRATLFDVVYDPWPTPLAAAAQRAGCRVVDGLSMLVHQAVRQVELMTGCERGPLEAMWAAGARCRNG